jgi:hypothetical protein
MEEAEEFLNMVLFMSMECPTPWRALCCCTVGPPAVEERILRHIREIRTFVLGIDVAPMARLKRRNTGRRKNT